MLSSCFLSRAMSVRLASAFLIAASTSIAIGVSDGGVGRLEPRRPEVRLVGIHDQRAQVVLDRLDRAPPR